MLRRYDGFHIRQLQSKTNRDGGWLLIVDSTFLVACPIRALTELLLSGVEGNMLFSNADGFANCDFFLSWLKDIRGGKPSLL